jgi:hypothetical protein
MATLIRTALFFALGALVAGFVLAAVSAFILGDVDPDFAHQPLAAFSNQSLRYLLGAVVESSIFGLGLLAARLLFAQKLIDNLGLAALAGALVVLINFLLSILVRKGFGRNYDVAALIYLLVVPLVVSFVYPLLARKSRFNQADAATAG